MIPNRSAPPGDVFPRLVYDDVGEAIRWLSEAFGFVERFRYGPPGQPQGALLSVGDGSVMLAGARAANPAGEWWERTAFRAPAGHPLSHTIGVRVQDIDGHCERARARGATILHPPETLPYGERQYSAVDPAGHRWDFSESVADVAPGDWGGVAGPALTGARPESGVARVNGLDLYYEMHGGSDGTPLVLLHGGVGGIEMFGPNLAVLARGRRVLALDLQGHGHTGDVERPLRYESMADDVAALLRELGVERADLMGYSLGGGTALQAAIRHPGVVRRLVLVSQPFARRGWFPEVLEGFDRLSRTAASGMDRSPLARLYPGKDWATLFDKLGELLRRDYDWSGDVAALRATTMLVFADADGIQPAHMLEFFRLLGGGVRDAGLDGSARPAARLAVVPGTTHYDILARPTVAALVTPFLDADD